MNRQSKATNVKKCGLRYSPQPRQSFRASRILILLVAVCCCTRSVHAFRVHDLTDLGYGGILRWDAAPHFVDGVERSLDGGLRYSLQGGSFEAYRDQFQWAAPTPTVAEFQMAVEQAFADWEAVDSASGLGTDVYFVPDFGTAVVFETVPSDLAGFFILNRGAEIDLLSDDLPDGYKGQFNAYADPNADSVTLTSGIANYPATVISGVDIVMNFEFEDGQIPWQLNKFQQILSHEIGHGLSLSDVDFEVDFDPLAVRTRFYDDNYDDMSSATALATLTNSFAGVIDPLDPDNSPGLMLYDVCQGTKPNDPWACTGDPGIDTAGVYIHMESSPTPGETQIGPQNDDFAGRQFLYPYVVPTADFDGDGDVDGADRAVWESSFGTGSGADADGDGDSDGGDFLKWQQQFGLGVPLQAETATVPEPATGIMLLIGIAMTLTGRRLVVPKLNSA